MRSVLSSVEGIRDKEPNSGRIVKLPTMVAKDVFCGCLQETESLRV